MKKPTPVQARLLKDLQEKGSYLFTYADSNGRVYSASLKSKENRAFKQKIRPATARACIQNKWVIVDPDDKWVEKFMLSTLGELVLENLEPKDFTSEKPENTAKDIMEILRDRYRPPEWVFFPELRFGVGYRGPAYQRIDAWAMSCWRSKLDSYLKIAFEIKVYRSDFLKEIKDPYKREAALSVSNQFYFVAPKGLISVDELPDECGLMEVSESGLINTIKTAPIRLLKEPPWMFVASLCRRIQRSEETNAIG